MRKNAFFGLAVVLGVTGCAVADEQAQSNTAYASDKSDPTSDPGAHPSQELDIGSGEEISLDQNTTWTVDMGAAKTYRVVAYGDSIFAGYQRSIFTVARRSGPHVAGEYLAYRWGANVEVVLIAWKSGKATDSAGQA